MRQGFTLVELSIVIVILGLLAGGVFSGQALIRASQLRSIATDYSRYVTAVQAFNQKYGALPGDMPNATGVWGAAAAGSACITTTTSDPRTCNGDGNGMIDDSANSNERFRFWQQLASAGLIPGAYSGISSGSNVPPYIADTTNSPVGKLQNSLWLTYNYGTQTGASDVYDGNYGQILQFGGIVAGTMNVADILTPTDANYVDLKMDDGLPGTGNVYMRTREPLATQTCGSGTTGASGANATYRLDITSASCLLVFMQAF